MHLFLIWRHAHGIEDTLVEKMFVSHTQLNTDPTFLLKENVANLNSDIYVLNVFD